MYQDAGQLPQSPSDVGNVIYTISNEDPKRSNALVVQLPVAEEIRKRPGIVYNDKDRRVAFGELIYTLIEANRTETGTNRKLFDVGEILEFDDDDIVIPDQMKIPKQVDIQHNTNLLDLEDIGLSVDEINSVITQVENRKKELENKVAEFQSLISNNQTLIQENQKKLNETHKAMNAVKIAFNDASNPIVLKLLAHVEELSNERDTLIATVNSLNDEASKAFDELIKVSTLVK